MHFVDAAPGFLPAPWAFAITLALLAGMIIVAATRGKLRALLIGDPPFLWPLAAAVLLCSFFGEFLGPWAGSISPYGFFSWAWMSWDWQWSLLPSFLSQWSDWTYPICLVVVVAIRAVWPGRKSDTCGLLVLAGLVITAMLCGISRWLTSFGTPSAYPFWHLAPQMLMFVLLIACLITSRTLHRQFVCTVTLWCGLELTGLAHSLFTGSVNRITAVGWISYAANLGIFLGGVYAWKKGIPHPAGHCSRCGYNLFGLSSDRCPECGSAAIHAAGVVSGPSEVQTRDAI